MTYKYPYIPNKKLYAAVMFAANKIRENGYFHKAVSTAAYYYDVDEKDIEKELRKRQAAGQKGKKRGKMKWFIIYDETIYIDSYSPAEKNNIRLKKGLQKDNMEKIISVEDGFCIRCVKVSKEFETKKDAMQYLEQYDCTVDTEGRVIKLVRTCNE